MDKVNMPRFCTNTCGEMNACICITCMYNEPPILHSDNDCDCNATLKKGDTDVILKFDSDKKENSKCRYFKNDWIRELKYGEWVER